MFCLVYCCRLFVARSALDFTRHKINEQNAKSGVEAALVLLEDPNFDIVGRAQNGQTVFDLMYAMPVQKRQTAHTFITMEKALLPKLYEYQNNVNAFYMFLMGVSCGRFQQGSKMKVLPDDVRRKIFQYTFVRKFKNPFPGDIFSHTWHWCV